MTPRLTVLSLLERMDESGSYSNIILDNALSRQKFDARDRAFATAIFYGVLERRMTLDYLIRHYSKIEFDELDIKTRAILRMGLYQLLYMDSVPDSAAVFESVSISHENSTGFVNAILRNFIRDEKNIDTSQLDEQAALSINYSCPKWIVKRWIKAYGLPTTVKILEASFGRPPLYIKVNQQKTNTEKLISQLKSEGIDAVRNDLVSDCLEISRLKAEKSLEETNAFRKGLFHVQDISSQLCCKLIRPTFHETILDLCAAPGGKTFTVSQYMNNTGKLVACDLYGGKLSLLEAGAKRLGLENIEVCQNDATVYNPTLELADRVLCDVPCSGLGVIRRKPEIKYKPLDSHKGLPELQKTILNTAAKYVKPGGSLYYSTCTLNPDENEQVAENFIAANPEFSSVIIPLGIKSIDDTSGRNFFPHVVGGDGFFVNTFRRGG
ncbi:MAG: 16S rRNA (cytosine(967)-C(5))-methyltransferase RsmB [Oscillospiraceae bacterium]|nr:16S rRNA (cytosine(967)-C(5))-methyltransferase RsmB [Oscillospiraceae bacterium]